MPIKALETELDFPWWLPVFSAAVPVLVVAGALHTGRPGWPTGLAVALAALAVLPFNLDLIDRVVPFRLSMPVWLFVPTVVVPVTIFLLHPADLDLMPFIFVLLSAEMASRLDFVRGATIALTCVGVMVGVEIAGIFQGSFIWVVGICFGWGGGYAVRIMLQLTQRLQQAQEGLAEKAASEERQRIAREIHDVIAHSMSVTILHLSAARMALERDRSAEALEALREAEQQGRNSLNEIRRTVGVLGPDEAATAPPMPTASDLPKLVADFRQAGLNVVLSTDGDLAGVPAATGLNLYRIVQESLTNVAKHAPGAKATVDLNVDGEDIRLRVHNSNGNGTASVERSAGGLGLKGMAGRAAMMGGSLSAGGEADGWTVTLTAPA